MRRRIDSKRKATYDRHRTAPRKVARKFERARGRRAASHYCQAILRQAPAYAEKRRRVV
jgi:hypothetical protein